ncbi:MAG: hypothetical protein QXG64_05770 [Acidilobaceae archaeon]
MIIKRLREEVSDINERILRAKSVTSPSMSVLRDFILNQLYIVPHDLKALSISMVKARDLLEYRFIKYLIDGDYNAYNALLKLAEELKVLFSYESLKPAAVSYTHFISWLSLHGNTGDLAIATAVNLPVWGANCLKLAKWAKENRVRNTEFMELFAGPYDEFESLAEEIASKYLDWDRYRFIAKTIQYYELMFWESIGE